MKYHTIVADPPWQYDGVASVGTIRKDGTPSINVGLADKYPTLTTPAICALNVRDYTERDAHLYLWTTNAFMDDAHDVARAWGFKPVTILTWVKTFTDDPTRVSMKTGYYFRGATEHVLFCTRGQGSRPYKAERALPTAYLWPRTPHSVKPDAFYDLVEEASCGPYLEMFARRQRLGWDTWGNEARCDVNLTEASQ